jgi:hypothetical protein
MMAMLSRSLYVGRSTEYLLLFADIVATIRIASALSAPNPIGISPSNPTRTHKKQSIDLFLAPQTTVPARELVQEAVQHSLGPSTYWIRQRCTIIYHFLKKSIFN